MSEADATMIVIMLMRRKIPLTIHLTKTTAAQNEVALSYHSVRGLYFLAVVFVTNILRSISYPCS